MTSQTFEYWQRKAAQARIAADILQGSSAKATMLEMADYYRKRAGVACRNAKLAPADWIAPGTRPA